jgi:hypothetical protein
MNKQTSIQTLFISIFLMIPITSYSADIYSPSITALYHECSVINLSGQEIPEDGSLVRLTDESGKITFAKKSFQNSLLDGETLMEFYKDPDGIATSIRCEVLYNGSPTDTLASHCGYNEKMKNDGEQIRVCNTLW